MLEAHVGCSTEPDSYRAGRLIAKEALEGASTKSKLAILAIDSLTRKKYDYGEVLKGVREEIGAEIPLIGSSVNGLIVNDRFALKSAGLLLLGGDFNVDAAFSFGKSRQKYQSIADEIVQIKKGLQPKPNQLMFMFQDGMKFPPETMDRQKSLNSRMVALFSGMITRAFKNQFEEFAEKGMGMASTQELIDRLYAQGWDIPIIGNLATNARDYDNVEFFNEKVLQDAVLGVILSGTNDTKFGYGFAAGAEPSGISCSITKNIGSFLLRINGKSAVKGFCEAVGIEKESLVELQNLGYINIYNILGTREKIGDKEYIHPVVTITNPDLENLIVSGFPFDKVPEKAEIFRSSSQILLKSTKEGIMEAKKNIDDPKFIIGIDCALRFTAFGDNLHKVVETYRETMGKDVTRFIIGSGGEVFATRPNGFFFNNYTVVTFVGGK